MSNRPSSVVDPDGGCPKWLCGGGNDTYAVGATVSNDIGSWKYLGDGNWDRISGSLWSDIGGFAKNLWNTDIARQQFPDIVNIGAGFNGIAGVGGYTNFDLQWVTRGPEASLYPAITITQAVGAGFSIDATVNIGGTSYLGNVNSINRGMLQTSINDGDATIWGSAGLALGGKIGAEVSYTPTSVGYGLVGRQLTIGVGLPAGPLPANGAGGLSNTFVIHDFYHGK